MIGETNKFLSLLPKMGIVGDVVTSSDRAFHVWVASTLNVLLPIVDSLNNDMVSVEWRSVYASTVILN